MFISPSVMGQRLKDSLFGGRLRVDTGKTFVSKGTGKYVAPKVYDAGAATSTTNARSPHPPALQK